MICSLGSTVSTLHYWSIDMLNFDFLEKGLTVCSPHFVHDFSRKMFLIFYSVNWPNLIAWLRLILQNMCIATIYFQECDVKNLEINHIFLIKPFFYLTKKWRQKLQYLENKKSFQVVIKSIFHHFLKHFQLPKTVSNLRVHL